MGSCSSTKTSTIPATAVSEPDHGSDVAGIRTTAARDGKGWLLNGTKAWVTLGGIADRVMVFARTGAETGHRAISCLLVDGGLPGIARGKSEELLGMVPAALRAAYRPLIDQRARDPALMRWVKAADALDAYLKCAMELAVGNREYADAERQLEAKARAMAMPEVDYFLAHFAPSFHKTLDEITE